jgi:predicted AlkP superfamily pyrophosphatase or phosphodiesterase
MIRITRALFAALALLTLAAPPALAQDRRPLILISIDGFHPDYLDRGLTPTLSALAAAGVRAQAMRPSFPVNTFPNHYTMVTGLRPDRHGLTDNTMFDEARPGVKFSMGARDQVMDRFWWDGGVPIWVTAEQQGVKAATMFWPGSEAAVRGVRPSLWHAYDEDLPAFDRVDRLLGWLDLPPAERPLFMTLYFEAVDTLGHYDGPDGPELNEAVRTVDLSLARLVAGLTARGLLDQVNLVIVSDHGMAPTSPERLIVLDEQYPAGAFRWITLGSMAGLIPADAEAESLLVGRHDHYECWRKGEMPARLNYGSHPRIPPVMCLADTGWTLTSRERQAARPMARSGGAHGYDPHDPAMQALFVAHGPAFRPGVVLAPFDNVSVYPLLARLLAVTPAPNDGDPADTAAALR